jgi:hypothetical protein
LFPEATPATVDELKTRFQELLDALVDGKPDDRVRIVPSEETAP